MSTLTLEIAGELAEYDGTPLTAAVLRGLLETVTTERVNLVNAGALAQGPRHHASSSARPRMPGAFAAQLTRLGARPAAAGRGGRDRGRGRAAHHPASATTAWTWRRPTSMLITRHTDKPGMVGRIGAMLGEADVNISAMHLARTRPREDALMILALDDDVPEAVSRPRSGPRMRCSSCGRSAWAATTERAGDDDGRRSSRTASTRPWSSSATASPSSSWRAGSRARPRRRCPRPACARPRSWLNAWRILTTRRPCPLPEGPLRELVHSPLRRTAQTAEAIAAAMSRPDRPRPEPGFLEIGQGEWEGLHRDEIGARYGDDAGGLASDADESVGARRRIAGPGRGAGPAGARRGARALAEGGTPGTLDRSQVAGYGDETPADLPWSIVVGHDGVFKVTPADAVRPAARAVLDVDDGPVRDHRRRVPRPVGPSCAPTT